MSDSAFAAASMPEVLRIRADRNPDDLAFCFLIDGEEEGPRLTYAELDRQARTIAAALQDIAAPGDRALLLYAPGLEFISALFGCQYAGIVPVPVYPPRLRRLAESLQALQTLAADCRPQAVLTGGPLAPLLRSGLGQVPALAGAGCLVTDDLDASLARRWCEPAFDADALALLQYTSGSTAAPKGVMVSHRNLMHNERMIHTAFEHYRGAAGGVCWLPPYHDMGLIGGLVQTVFHGAWCMLMSPQALLQDPFRWLEALSRYRADTSGGPNFVYDLCVQRTTPEQRASLDLRTWSVAAIGSEPVNHRTMEEFAEAFASSGFRPETFYPCYGLAEATLLVAGGLRSAPPVIRPVSGVTLEQGQAVDVAPGAPDARALVGCGRSWLDQELRIADPESGVSCSEGQVGEIWVKGQSVAAGYWGRPDETEATFCARLNDTGDDSYLRTGDLGFVTCGELFVTGRLKDVLIMRGRNHYPQDIEETVQSVHRGLRRGCGAAFEASRRWSAISAKRWPSGTNCRCTTCNCCNTAASR